MWMNLILSVFGMTVHSFLAVATLQSTLERMSFETLQVSLKFQILKLADCLQKVFCMYVRTVMNLGHCVWSYRSH